MSWDINTEKHLNKISFESQYYKNIHYRKFENYKCKYDILMYLAIICGPLSGMIISISYSLDSEDEPIYVILSSCIAYLSGILIGIVKFSDVEEKIIKHQTASLKYHSLLSSITRQLELDSDIRVESKSYIEWANTTFDELLSSSPMVKLFDTNIKLSSKKYKSSENLEVSNQQKYNQKKSNKVLISIVGLT